MVVSDFVPAVILRAEGKTSTSVSGDTKWMKVLGIANLQILNWQDEPDVDWGSLYNRALAIGTVTATDTFALDLDTLRTISSTFGDPVRITWTNTNGTTSYTDYDIINYDALKEYPDGNYCAQIGSNLVFNQPFLTTAAEFGGTITVPALLYADSIAADGDTIPVDNPNWLVVATAAEYIRTDVTRQNQYPNLAAEANSIMERMKDVNDGQISHVDYSWKPLSRTWY